MTTQQVVELVIGAGGVGGLVRSITVLTRLTVAVEEAGKTITTIIEDHKETKKQVADLENRLNRGGL